MSWPQIVILVWMLFQTVIAIKSEVSNRTQSSGMATFGVLFIIALECGIAAVLHAGGFW